MPQSRHENSIAKTVNLYRVIDAYIAKNKYSPSFDDLIKAGAFSSKFMCFWHMKRLIGWGLLESKPRLSRTLRLNPITSAPDDVQKYFEEKSHAT